MATRPTELVVFDGAPDWVPVESRNLLYVANTTGNVFLDIQSQVTYVLVTGRWFSAPDLNGPWTHVPGKSLPPDFAMVPDGSPEENMKASVPGTPQAAAAGIGVEGAAGEAAAGAEADGEEEASAAAAGVDRRGDPLLG